MTTGLKYVRGRTTVQTRLSTRSILALSVAIIVSASFIGVFQVWNAGATSHGLLGGHGVEQVAGPAFRPAALCNGLNYQTQHFSVGTSGCQIFVSVAWAQNPSEWSSSDYNYSFAIEGLAEINSAGQIVEYSNLLMPVGATTSIQFTPSLVNLSINETQNVTQAYGSWNPGAVREGVNQTGSTIGTVIVQAVFHMQNSTSSTSGPANALKFDVDVSGWPWANVNDHLGLQLSALAAGGAEFAWNSQEQNLTEIWDSGGQPYAGLQLSPTAGTFGSSQGPSTVTVSSDAGLFSAASPDREAILLMNFTGGAVGYTSLHYDPWIIFSGSGSTPGSPTSASSAGSAIPVILVIGLTVVVAAVVLSVMAIARARKSSIRTPPRGPEPRIQPPAIQPTSSESVKEEDPLDHLL